MTVLNFPSTTGQPTDGSFTYTENGVIYTWNGSYWAANNADNLDSRYVNVSGDTMTGDLTVPSLNGGPLAGFRNQIINGDFRIWQRSSSAAATSGATPEYVSADRWIVSYQTTLERWGGAPSVDVPAEFANVANINRAVSGTAFIRQAVELDSTGSMTPFTSNSVWTFSFWSTSPVDVISAGFADDNATAGNNQQITTNTIAPTGESVTSSSGRVFVRYSASLVIDKTAVATNTIFHIGIAKTGFTGDFQVAQFQLEPGPVATPFEHRPIGTELALCQRYYQLLQVRRINGETNWYTIPVKMRVRPTGSADTETLYDDSFGVRSGAAGRVDITLDAEL